jgi:cytoskeletal protein RodZ
MSIGSELKQARINKGISIEEVSNKTKIQQRFLEAIEDDNIARLPNAVYAKSFLKKYSQFLGVDPAHIVEQFEKSPLSDVKQVIMLEGERLPSTDPERYFKKAIFGVALFLVLVGVVIFLFSTHKPAARPRPPVVKIQRPQPAAPIRGQVKKKDRQAGQAVQPAAVKARPTQPDDTPQQPKPVALNLSVLAKKTCRLSLRADGKLLFDSFLLAGSSDQWRARQQFELSVSDGAAIDLLLNGRRIGSAGRGPVKRIIITKDGIKR